MCMFMFMSIYRLWVLLVQFIIMPIFFGGNGPQSLSECFLFYISTSASKVIFSDASLESDVDEIYIISMSICNIMRFNTICNTIQYRMQYQVPYGNLIYCSSYGKSPFHIATLDHQRIIRNVFGFSSNQLYQLAQPPRYMWADARVLPMKAIQERKSVGSPAFLN
jgi:hypothetical protein